MVGTTTARGVPSVRDRHRHPRGQAAPAHPPARLPLAAAAVVDRPRPLNPFAPPPAVEPATYIGLLVDALADAYDLGDGAVSVLQKAIHACYAGGSLSPRASQVLGRLQEGTIAGRAAGWAASATRAL